MGILKIDGASTDDERAALHEVVAIWETGGACFDALLNRLPRGRVEVRVASNANDEQLAVVRAGTRSPLRDERIASRLSSTFVRKTVCGYRSGRLACQA